MVSLSNKGHDRQSDCDCPICRSVSEAFTRDLPKLRFAMENGPSHVVAIDQSTMVLNYVISVRMDEAILTHMLQGTIIPGKIEPYGIDQCLITSEHLTAAELASYLHCLREADRGNPSLLPEKEFATLTASELQKLQIVVSAGPRHGQSASERLQMLALWAADTRIVARALNDVCNGQMLLAMGGDGTPDFFPVTCLPPAQLIDYQRKIATIRR